MHGDVGGSDVDRRRRRGHGCDVDLGCIPYVLVLHLSFFQFFAAGVFEEDSLAGGQRFFEKPEKLAPVGGAATMLYTD